MSVEKSAFDFVEKVQSASSIAVLEDLFLEHAEPMGVELAVCAQILAPDGSISRKTLFGAFRHDWFSYYQRHHLFFHDVVVRRATKTNHPMLWSEIGRGDLTTIETEVMEEPRNFRLADGLAIPIHGAGRSVACMSMAGEHFVHDATIEAALHMMTISAHRMAVVLLGYEARHRSGPVLTPRQRECLHWVQHGKSNDDIAAILGISSHTVKEHIDTARRLLGVGTRLEAVIEARRANLIGL